MLGFFQKQNHQKMKKFIIIPLICFFAYGAFAQITPSGFVKTNNNFTLNALLDASTIPTSGIQTADTDFSDWGADEDSPPVPMTGVSVYIMTDSKTSAGAFGSFASDVGDLCFTQAQIINVINNHPEILQGWDYGTLFLFRSYSQFFIADVRMLGGKPIVILRRYAEDQKWPVGSNLQIVIPVVASEYSSFH